MVPRVTGGPQVLERRRRVCTESARAVKIGHPLLSQPKIAALHIMGKHAPSMDLQPRNFGGQADLADVRGIRVFTAEQIHALRAVLRKSLPDVVAQGLLLERIAEICALWRVCQSTFDSPESVARRRGLMTELFKRSDALQQIIAQLDGTSKSNVDSYLQCSGSTDGGGLKVLTAQLECLRGSKALHFELSPVKRGRRPSLSDAAEFLSLVLSELRRAGVKVVQTEGSACEKVCRICLDAVGRGSQDNAQKVIKFVQDHWKAAQQALHAQPEQHRQTPKL